MSVCSLSLPYQRNLHLIDLFRTHILRLPIRISDQPAYYQPVIEGSAVKLFVRVFLVPKHNRVLLGIGEFPSNIRLILAKTDLFGKKPTPSWAFILEHFRAVKSV